MLSLTLYWFWMVSQPPSAPPAISWSSELRLSSLGEIDAALATRFEGDSDWEVTTETGTKRHIRSCRDFLEVVKTKLKFSTESEWSTLQAAGARCFALRALQSATVPSRSYLGRFRFSAAAIRKLPPTLDMLSSPESEESVAKAQKSCTPWGKYDPSLTVRINGIDRALLRTDGWSGALVLYARGDFDGDGIEDLLLRRDGHVDQGTAADSTVFIVSQTSDKNCARVTRTMRLP